MGKKSTQDVVDGYDWEASGEELKASLRPLHQQLVELGVADATNELESSGIPSTSFHLRREELDDITEYLGDQIKGVSDTTRQRVQTIVDTQNKEGLSIPQTAHLIQQVGEIDSRSRATMIARTETATAYNLGSLLTYGKAGITHVRVYDGDQDEPCASANGSTWTVEEAAANPIAHPNCRRFFAPVVDIEQPTPAGEPPSGGALGEADTFTAQGTPVSDALDLPGGKLGKSLQTAVDAINSVHGDGALPRIPVRASSGTTTLGSYTYYGSGRPDQIKISTKGEHQELTMVHELGHFLDHQGIGTPGELGTTKQDQVFKKFQRAADGSDAIQGLRDLRKKIAVDVVGADGKVYKAYVNNQYIAYLTSRAEVWARAYAQYIAVRSGDPTLMAQLRKEQASLSPYQHQWADKDFEPIAESIDEILELQGWRVKK